MRWSVEFFDEKVRGDLFALSIDLRASFERIVRLIETYGLPKVHAPYVKHLQGSLWEMRMKGRDGIARAVYITVKDRRVVVVHVFVKKTEKTPRREIELALRRAEEFKP